MSVDEALALFEAFLERYHAGEASVSDLDDLCAREAQHSERLRRWWQQLIESGEVDEAGSTLAGARDDASPVVGAASSGDAASSSSEGSRADISTETGLPEIGSDFGPYRLISELGRGSQGTVFLAHDARLGRNVALKVLPAWRMGGRDPARRFAREAELASRLDHPGICTVFERGVLAGAAYLAMRYVEGSTLSARLDLHKARRKRGEVDGLALRLDASTADETAGERDSIASLLAVFESIAEALHAAHESKLIHRDVKPGNVVIDKDHNPVLLDFGLARDVEEEELTLTGDLVGTPAYMSPEQIAAQRIELDRRSDVYSLGATLFECLTGRRPFEAPTRNELYQQILTAETPSARRLNPAIPRDLDVVLQTALEKDRLRRYQSAADLAADLARVRRREPILARPAGPLLRTRRWVQRNPAIAGSLAIVFLALSIGLAVSLAFHAETRRARAAFDRLTDRTVLENARRRAARLRPAHPRDYGDPAREKALAAWMQEFGDPLRERHPGLREHLENLRSSAEPYSDEDRRRDRETHPAQLEIDRLEREIKGYESGIEQTRVRGRPGTRRLLEGYIATLEARILELRNEGDARRTWRFEREDERLAHAALARLVDELDDFLAPSGLRAQMAAELDWTKRAAERTLEAQRDAWKSCQARLAKNKLYTGLKLEAQIGLVPLGANPQGYEEFAMLRSGTRPKRKDNGELAIDEGSAIVFVLIPAGKVEVGLRVAPRAWEDKIAPIDIAAFFMGKHEISRGQWQRLKFRKAPGSLQFAAYACDAAHHPVEGVSWLAARDFLRSFALDLPSEAQWEYTARRGLDSENFLAVFDKPQANVADATFAGFARLRTGRRPYDDGFDLLAPIGSLHPDACGLHDMIGNVAEWCREAWFPALLSHFVMSMDGTGYFHVPTATRQRSVRGGSFDTRLRNARIGVRNGRLEALGHPGVGFRATRRLIR